MVDMMRAFSLFALAMVYIGSFASVPFAVEEVLPLPPVPIQRAGELDQPARAVHLALAKAMHENQEKQLAAAKADGVWRCHFILGLAFALEEYYQMELSFPDCVSQLEESGYLLEGWREAGLAIADFTADSANCSEWTLIYVPQPIGLASLIRIPGSSCVSMRSYSEYSLLVPEKHYPLWKAGAASPHTWWLKPFLAFKVREITYFNQIDQRLSRCGCALQ